MGKGAGDVAKSFVEMERAVNAYSYLLYIEPPPPGEEPTDSLTFLANKANFSCWPTTIPQDHLEEENEGEAIK